MAEILARHPPLAPTRVQIDNFHNSCNLRQMNRSPEEIRMIEAMTQGHQMTEQEAIDYLAANRREASKTTRSDARFAALVSLVGIIICGSLIYIQYNHGRFSIKLMVALWVGFAFCFGAFIRNFRNVNAH